jgi:hypothetical protein
MTFFYFIIHNSYFLLGPAEPMAEYGVGGRRKKR